MRRRKRKVKRNNVDNIITSRDEFFYTVWIQHVEVILDDVIITEQFKAISFWFNVIEAW